MEHSTSESQAILQHSTDIFSNEAALFYWAQLKISDIMNRNVVTLSHEQTIKEAARLMDRERISCVLVTSNKKLVGILQQKNIIASIQAKEDPTLAAIGDWMSEVVKVIDPYTPVLFASKIMDELHLKHLPVVSEEGVTGIVTQTDIVRAFESMSGLRSIAEIMSTDIVTIAPDVFIEQAIDVMANKNISCVLVTRHGKAEGILTEKDILRIIIEQGQNLNQTRIVDVMSFPVITIPPSQSIVSASRLMYEKHLHRLVVADNTGPLGIVTKTDILKCCQTSAQLEIQNNLHMLFSTDEATILLDNEGITTYVNPAFLNLFNADSPRLFMNQPFPPDVLWVDTEGKRDYLENHSINTGEFETMLLHKVDRGYVSISICFNDIKDRMGNVIGKHGVAWDISRDEV